MTAQARLGVPDAAAARVEARGRRARGGGAAAPVERDMGGPLLLIYIGLYCSCEVAARGRAPNKQI